MTWARTAVGAVLAVALLALVPAPAPAAEALRDRPDLAALPLGEPAAVAWMRDWTIHRADGTTLAVRPPAGARYPRLVGHSDRGWVVEATTLSAPYRLYLVRGHRAMAFHTWDDHEYSTDFRLARDGSTILRSQLDRGGSTFLAVLGLDGRVVRSASFKRYVNPLDFTGPRAVLSDGRYVYDWRVGRSLERQPDVTYPYIADIDRDLLYVDTGEGLVGPTSLDHPTADLPWATKGDPHAVSPDGDLLLATAPRLQATYQLRSTHDGHLVRSFRIGGDVQGTIGWEDDDTFFFEAGVRGRRALFRCDVDGSCERTTGWGTDDISTPFEDSRID